ncbi:MAG: S1C family serine protease [Bacteroidota bacterium]
MNDSGWRKYLPFIFVAVLSSLTTSAVFLSLDRLGNRGQSAPPSSLSAGSATPVAFDGDAFIAARRRVEPAVVYIDVQSIQASPFSPDDDFFPFLSPFREFFRPQIRQGTGSGFIFRSDGHILTNYHVVQGAQKLQVTLADKRKFPGRVVGTDREMDLAVVKIDARNLPTVTFGDSDRLQSGQWVLAIGNPLGYHHTVTAGIVSALNRSVENPDKNGYLIQTDASINRGNSGGPLVDLQGRVVGINVAIVSDVQGIGSSLGFAIPIKIAEERLKDLTSGRNNEATGRPWLGVSLGNLEDLTADIRREYNLPSTGALIIDVVPGGPADEAGLERLDVVVSFNLRTVKSAEDLQKMVRGAKVGQTVTLGVRRDGRVRLIRVKLGAMPQDQKY